LGYAAPFLDLLNCFTLFFNAKLCHKKLHLLGWIYCPTFGVQFSFASFFLKCAPKALPRSGWSARGFARSYS